MYPIEQLNIPKITKITLVLFSNLKFGKKNSKWARVN